MSICLIQLLKQQGMPIIAVFLTLAALGFSIFGTIYSNLIHNAEMAEGNALQPNVILQAYWLKASRRFRGLARSRAYSANLCFWSLLLIIITLILFFTPLRIPCLVTFIIAGVFLVIALIVAKRLCGYKKSSKLETKRDGKLINCFLWCRCWPINPDVPRLTEDC